MKRRLWVTSAVVGLAFCVGFSLPGKSAAAETATSDVGLLAFSVQTETIHKAQSQESIPINAAKSKPPLSLLDIIGIVLFLALIGAHFWMCRNGVYPESSCFCEAPPWMRKLAGKVGRKVSGA